MNIFGPKTNQVQPTPKTTPTLYPTPPSSASTEMKVLDFPPPPPSKSTAKVAPEPDLTSHIKTLGTSLEKARDGADIYKKAFAKAFLLAGVAAGLGTLAGGIGAIIGAPIFILVLIRELVGSENAEKRANNILSKDEAFKGALKEVHTAFKSNKLDEGHRTQIKELIATLSKDKKGHLWNTDKLGTSITGEETEIGWSGSQGKVIGQQNFEILNILQEMLGDGASLPKGQGDVPISMPTNQKNIHALKKDLGIDS